MVPGGFQVVDEIRKMQPGGGGKMLTAGTLHVTGSWHSPASDRRFTLFPESFAHVYSIEFILQVQEQLCNPTQRYYHTSTPPQLLQNSTKCSAQFPATTFCAIPDSPLVQLGGKFHLLAVSLGFEPSAPSLFHTNCGDCTGLDQLDRGTTIEGYDLTCSREALR